MERNDDRFKPVSKFVDNILTWLLLIAVAAAICFSFAMLFGKCAHAEEVKTTIIFRNDFVKPETGDSFIKQWTTIQWNAGAITAGTEIFTKTETDYLGIRPYGAVNLYKGFDVMAGYQTDSKGVEYAPVGFWYYPSIGKLNIFLDAREYVAVSRLAKDFMEFYLGLTYWATEKNSVGLDTCYDRYWKDKADELGVGINFSRKLSSNFAIFVRPTRDWYAPKNGATIVTDSVRIGAKLSF